MNNVNVRTAQKPLRRQYVNDPGSAMVLDRARTTHPDPDDPFHSTVEPMPGCGISTPVGVHQALGGPHDAPTPVTSCVQHWPPVLTVPFAWSPTYSVWNSSTWRSVSAPRSTYAAP